MFVIYNFSMFLQYFREKLDSNWRDKQNLTATRKKCIIELTPGRSRSSVRIDPSYGILRQSSSSSRQNLFTLRTTVCKALLLLLERASDSPCMIAIFISCMITLARSESFFHCWNNSFSMLESDVRTCRRTWCTQN